MRGVHGDVEEVEFFREGEIFGNQTPAGVYAIFFGEQGFVIGKTDDGGQRRLGSGKAARRATQHLDGVRAEQVIKHGVDHR